MRFLDRLLGNSQPLKECPRCLGKGHVDQEDIKRLRQELMWQPGVCAYCNGTGKINPKIEINVPVDASYLVMDLPESERKKILHGNPDAIMHAQQLNDEIEAFISRIYKLHTERGLTPQQIANLLLAHDGTSPAQENEWNEMIAYIKKVIEQRTRG